MSPKGFWSYARGDDDHLDGVLSGLRKQIEGEVSMLLGHDVDIFQDIHDLRTGDRWAEALRAGVTKAAFLIPVLTPRFFNRDWCREEVLTFLQIARDKGLEPRIFPIRFAKWKDDKDCEVRAALAPFQYKDLSNWRFESDPTQRSKLIYEFAEDVMERLDVPPVLRPLAKPSPEAIVMRPEVMEIPKGKIADGTKYKTYVVDPFPGRGDFSTIGAAIAAAEAGSKIVVREGTYREALRLSKPLEIVGEGDRERILVVTDKGDALHCDAPMARVSGMRFRREVGGVDFGIWITGGGVEIEDCVVESLSASCVAIFGESSAPTIRRCVFRNSVRAGLVVTRGAQPTVEDCEISGNDYFGVYVSGASTTAIFRRCVTREGKSSGYLFAEGSKGSLERCEISGNAYYGVVANTSADIHLRDCVLRSNRTGGAYFHENGRGRLEHCSIEANGAAGLTAATGGALEVTGCTISKNAYAAVWIEDIAGGGVFRGNDLSGNMHRAWSIAEGAQVERVDNTE